MTPLFVQLAQTVTGNVITIVALELAAAVLGYIVAWYYAKSVYTPVIKGLETEKSDLTSQVSKLEENIKSLKAESETLNGKITKLEETLANKGKELEELSEKRLAVGKYVVSAAKNGNYHFNLKATNGQVILSSEMYSTKAACMNGIESVQNNCNEDVRYDRLQSSNDKSYFNLKASNGQIIGTSEMYESEANMEKGIASVKRNGISKDIVEE
jgi:uncharacterized protein YegP (UPF0339 family)/cell division protein FtsB